MQIILALVALIAGLIAAYYWFLSARVDFRKLGRLAEPVNEAVLDSMAQWIFELGDNMRDGAALNKRAAIWTAVSVILGAIANILASWPA